MRGGQWREVSAVEGDEDWRAKAVSELRALCFHTARSAWAATGSSRSTVSAAAYATALDASIGTERKGPHTPVEAPGEDWPEDKDYQLERAFDVLRAGGDLTRLAAAPEGIVVTAPGSALAATEPEPAPEN